MEETNPINRKKERKRREEKREGGRKNSKEEQEWKTKHLQICVRKWWRIL